MEGKINFNHFIEKFPFIDLPVTLGEESHYDFARHNDPLPMAMIEQFMDPLEEEPMDELTEFVACFRLRQTEGFHALVYWRAALLNYHYRLVTFTTRGELLDHRVIAGTFSDGDTLTTSVATIDEDWEILILSGQASALPGQPYDAASSKAVKMELLPDGTVADV